MFPDLVLDDSRRLRGGFRQPPSRNLMRFGSLMLVLSVWGPARAADPELPPAFLDQLPRQAASVPTVSRLLVEQLRQIDDVEQRARGWGSLGSLLPLSPEFDEGLKRDVEQAVEEIGAPYVSLLAPLVAHFPALRAKLLGKIDDPQQRDRVRAVFASHVADFALARRICGEIDLPARRRDALERLAVRARSVEEMISLLEESRALQSQPDGWTYSAVYLLQRYAAAAPQMICDFVARAVPPDESMYIYTNFANRVSRENPAAAEMYMHAAWSRISATAKPYKHAPWLLAHDPRGVDRATWVAKFDQHVLPALRDAATEIGPLDELARFDIDLLIDRTRKSCLLPARPFEKIFPKVMEGAFRVNPAAVLTWLESTDSELKDRCVLEIVEFLSLPDSIQESSRESYFNRLCDLTLEVQDPGQRLPALADLAAGLTRAGCKVPDRVTADAQVLLNQQFDFQTIDLRDSASENFFWLATSDQRKQLIQTQIDKLRAAQEYQERVQLGGVCHDISESGLPPREKMIFYREAVTIAEGYADRYLQARIASFAVAIEVPWAIKTMWKILPDDRGRSGKRFYIDWTPPPDDARDAIGWLKMNAEQPEIQIKLLVALWEHLRTVPPVDRDSLRSELSRSLLKYRQFDAALALARQIKDPAQQAEALVALLFNLK